MKTILLVAVAAGLGTVVAPRINQALASTVAKTPLAKHQEAVNTGVTVGTSALAFVLLNRVL